MTSIVSLSLPGAVGMAETVPAGPAGSNTFPTLLSALQPGGDTAASTNSAAVLPAAAAAATAENGSAWETACAIDLAAEVASSLPPVASGKPQAADSSDSPEADRPVFAGTQVEASNLPADSEESSDGAPWEGGNPRNHDSDRNVDEPPAPTPTAAWTPVVLPVVAPLNVFPAEPAAELPNAPLISTAGRGTQSKLLGLPDPHGTKQSARYVQVQSVGSPQDKQSDGVSPGGSNDASDALSALEDLARLPGQSGMTAQVSTARSHVGTQTQSPASELQPGLAGGDLSQLDALVRDIAELSGSSGRAAFRVSGRELGDVQVQLRTTDAGLSVNIRTQSEHSHSAVAQAQGQLADDMRANGLKVAATSVAVGHEGAERGGGERHPVPRHVPVETAPAPEPEQPQNEQRRHGRYA